MAPPKGRGRPNKRSKASKAAAEPESQMTSNLEMTGKSADQQTSRAVRAKRNKDPTNASQAIVKNIEKKPRKLTLTDDRKNVIRKFMFDIRTHLDKYGKIGSNHWIQQLVRKFGGSAKNDKQSGEKNVSVADVKTWLKCPTFAKMLEDLKKWEKNGKRKTPKSSARRLPAASSPPQDDNTTGESTDSGSDGNTEAMDVIPPSAGPVRPPPNADEIVDPLIDETGGGNGIEASARPNVLHQPLPNFIEKMDTAIDETAEGSSIMNVTTAPPTERKQPPPNGNQTVDLKVVGNAGKTVPPASTIVEILISSSCEGDDEEMKDSQPRTSAQAMSQAGGSSSSKTTVAVVPTVESSFQPAGRQINRGLSRTEVENGVPNLLQEPAISRASRSHSQVPLTREALLAAVREKVVTLKDQANQIFLTHQELLELGVDEGGDVELLGIVLAGLGSVVRRMVHHTSHF